MPRGIAGTILKLLLASLAVGFLLSALGITPASILTRMGGTLRGAFETAASLFSGTFEYILLGATLVVPVWLVVVLVKSARK